MTTATVSANASPLRTLRRAAGLTIEALAYKAKLSATIVRLAERHPSTMSERTARRCARVLGVDPAVLR
jgi:ribosome-binding protein aMBF1 (putative translation factor)